MTFQKGHKIGVGNKHNLGRKHTEEWKQAARERMLGNTRGFVVGKPSPRKGKKATKPVWNKGKKLPQTTGPNNSRWKGGKTRDIHSLFNPRYVEWRKSVFLRDGYVCKISNEDCSKTLQAHHILRWADYPELRYEVNNGITLCAKHHPRKKIDEKALAPKFFEIIGSSIPYSVAERSVE